LNPLAARSNPLAKADSIFYLASTSIWLVEFILLRL